MIAKKKLCACLFTICEIYFFFFFGKQGEQEKYKEYEIRCINTRTVIVSRSRWRIDNGESVNVWIDHG